MPSELVRSDRVLMHYITKKAHESDNTKVHIQTILQDLQSIQEESGEPLYDILSNNEHLESPEIEKELRQFQGLKKVEIDGGGFVHPLGMGRLSGGFLELPENVEEPLNETVTRETSDTDN